MLRSSPDVQERGLDTQPRLTVKCLVGKFDPFSAISVGLETKRLLVNKWPGDNEDSHGHGSYYNFLYIYS
jgi:hypothetical protein